MYFYGMANLQRFIFFIITKCILRYKTDSCISDIRVTDRYGLFFLTDEKVVFSDERF